MNARTSLRELFREIDILTVLSLYIFDKTGNVCDDETS